jgi:ParB-like chromosome segregation protein Spo0J
MFKEISLDLIDENPFQTRKKIDEDAFAGIVTTASDLLGLRNPPLVRVMKGRYQIASGHSRVKAFKELKRKSILCRVELLSDAQMKKEVLVENVNHSEFSEDELWLAVEQYREELGLSKDEKGFMEELSAETGIPSGTLHSLYDVRHMREVLDVSPVRLDKKPSADFIKETIGLDDADRIKLLKKAQDRGWNREFTRNVKQVIQKLEPEVKDLILGKEHTLSPIVIQAVSKIQNSETQQDVIAHIQTHGLDEKLALKQVENIMLKSPIEEARVIIEEKDLLNMRARRIAELEAEVALKDDRLARIEGQVSELIRELKEMKNER